MPSINVRSPYGIKEPARPPTPNPWYVRFITSLSERSERVRRRYQQNSASGQIPASNDSYATKLESGWHASGARGPRADPIVQTEQVPTERPTPLYVHQPGSGRWTPLNRSFKQDPRRTFRGVRRPSFLQHFDPMETLHSGPQRTDEYLPTRFSLKPPMRIPRPHHAGVSHMPGVLQFGTRQTYGQGETSAVIAPVNVIIGMPSRGVRSIRGGVYGRAPIGTGRERIPAVFTPSQVQ